MRGRKLRWWEKLVKADTRRFGGAGDSGIYQDLSLFPNLSVWENIAVNTITTVCLLTAVVCVRWRRRHDQY